MTRPAATKYVLLLAGVLAVAVIAYAGRDELVWRLCVGAIGALALVYVSRYVARPVERGIILLAVLAPAYVAFQLLPIPLPLLRLLSPRRADIAEGLGAVMAPPWAAPLSVEPAATAALLMIVLACTLCFLLVRELTWLSLRRGSWLTVVPLLAIAAFEGALALWEASNGETVDGSYKNRNHLAGMLEMVLPLGVAWVLFAQRRAKSERPVAAARGMLRSLVVGAAMPMLALSMIFGGVLASGSKMGYVATLFGLLVMGLVTAAIRFSGRRRWAAIAALPVIAIVGFALLGHQDVLLRLTTLLDRPDGATAEGRVPIWADSLRLLAAYPVFGSGLGTYATAFLPFQTAGLTLHWTHAHNDYVEMATDLGIVGFATFGLMILLVVIRAIRLVLPVRRAGGDLMALGCLGGFASIGLHSIVDFNLAIPANSLLLAWITGIAAGIPPKSDTPTLKVRGPRQVRLAVIGLAVVALAMSATRIIAGTPDVPPEERTLAQRLDEVRKNPALPFAWLDLAEGFVASGQMAEARASASKAVAFGPRVPVVLLRAATVLDDVGDRSQAVALVSRELERTGADTAEAFGWFDERGIPSADVLAGLANDARMLPAYLRYLMLPGTCGLASQAWQVLLPHRPDRTLVSDYVYFLINECDGPEDAAQAWTDYARQTVPGYRVTEWMFNGDFEIDTVPELFSWHWNPQSREAVTALDNADKFSGSRSLRMVFRGPSQAAHEGALQQVTVVPGAYRFSSAVRTLGMKSADGIQFRIFNENGPLVDVRTEQATGTTEWHTISADFIVPEGTTMLRIQVVRRPGPGAATEEDMAGTAWVDAVTLSKVG